MEERVVLTPDQCIIDDEHFFVIGNIVLPIIGGDDVFQWTAWVSLSEANFDRMTDLWETVERESEPAYFGWLNTELPLYPDTVDLKTMVHTQPVGERPLIEVEPTDHPVAVEQRMGITWERVREIAGMMLHDEEKIPYTT